MRRAYRLDQGRKCFGATNRLPAVKQGHDIAWRILRQPHAPHRIRIVGLTVCLASLAALTSVSAARSMRAN